MLGGANPLESSTDAPWKKWATPVVGTVAMTEQSACCRFFMKFFHLYLYRFTGECIPIIPLLGIFLSQSGLSLSQISIVFFTLAFTVFLLEIPTGVIADRVQTKLILVLSRLLKLLAFSCLYFYPVFLGFIAFAFLWGVSSALDSGAFQAYVFYSSSDDTSFEKKYSRAMTASMFGLLVCTLIASQILVLGFHNLQLLGLFFLIFSLLLATLLPHVVAKNHYPEKSEYGFLPALKHVQLSGILPILLIVGVSAGSIKGSLDEYTSLLFSAKAITLSTIGYTLFFFEVLKSSGGLLSQWIKVSVIQQYVILIIFGICFIVAGVGQNYILVLFALAIVTIFDSILWIQNDTSIQIAATDQNRATIASVKNFSIELFSMLIFFSIWLLGDHLTTEKIYTALGGFLVFIGIMLVVHKICLRNVT